MSKKAILWLAGGIVAIVAIISAVVVTNLVQQAETQRLYNYLYVQCSDTFNGTIEEMTECRQSAELEYNR